MNSLAVLHSVHLRTGGSAVRGVWTVPRQKVYNETPNHGVSDQ